MSCIPSEWCWTQKPTLPYHNVNTMQKGTRSEATTSEAHWLTRVSIVTRELIVRFIRDFIKIFLFSRTATPTHFCLRSQNRVLSYTISAPSHALQEQQLRNLWHPTNCKHKGTFRFMKHVYLALRLSDSDNTRSSPLCGKTWSRFPDYAVAKGHRMRNSMIWVKNSQ